MTRISTAIVLLSGLLLVGALFYKPQKDISGVEISYGCSGTPEQIVMERKLLNRFEAENPGIRVKLRTPSSGGYMEKLLTELAGRVAPDVTFMGVEHFQQFAEKKVFLPLEPFMERDGTFDPEDYFPEIIRTFSREGKLQALPKNAASDVIFYNKEHFAAAGVPYPDETWTWDDMLSASLRLTRDLDGDGRTDRFALANVNFLDLLRQHGVEVISEDGKRCTLNTLEAERVCKFAYDLIYKHGVIPSQTQMGGFGVSAGGASAMGIFDLFAAEHVSMMIFDVVLCLKYQNSPFDWDTAMQPTAPLGRDSYIHGAGYAINSRTKHPEQAWKLVRFLAGPYVQRTRAVAGDSLPSLKEIAYSDVWRITTRKPQNRDAVTSQMLTALPPPPHPRWPRIMSEVYMMYGEFTAEENPVPVKTALRVAEEKINRVLRNED